MSWNLQEALAYYQKLGAPRDQSALTALLREIQQEHGGSIPASAVTALAEYYGIKEGLPLAIIRRIPSLRLEEGHCIELCAGPSCGKSAALAGWVEKTYGGRLAIRHVPCMRLCGKGPNIRYDGRLYHRASEELIRELVEES